METSRNRDEQGSQKLVRGRLDPYIETLEPVTLNERVCIHPRRPAFLVVAALDLAAAAASVVLWWRTRGSYAQEYLVVRGRVCESVD